MDAKEESGEQTRVDSKGRNLTSREFKELHIK
jgi:hypothetical protein